MFEIFLSGFHRHDQPRNLGFGIVTGYLSECRYGS